jgi:hypothetical protein
LRKWRQNFPIFSLLEGPANVEKHAALPAEWLQGRFPVAKDRDHSCSIHLLGDIPVDLQEFEAFCIERRT